MLQNALIRRPRPIAGSALDTAIGSYVHGLGYDPVWNADNEVFDRLVIVPHGIMADGFIVDAVTANHVAAALACSMSIDLIYLNPETWPYAERDVSTDRLPIMRIGSASEIKSIEGAIRKTSNLCGRSLKRPGISGMSPLLSLTIEPKRERESRSNHRVNDVRQTHLPDYLIGPS